MANSQYSRFFNPAVMAPTRIKLLNDLAKQLNHGKDLVICGDAGVGKTLVAKMLSGRAIQEGKFHVAFWIYIKPDDKPCDQKELEVLVKRQLRLHYLSEKLEAEGEKDAEKERNEKEEDQPSEVGDIKEMKGGNKEENQQHGEASDANFEKEKMEEHKNSEGDKMVEERRIFEEEELEKILKEKNVLFVFDGHVKIEVIEKVLENKKYSFLLITKNEPSSDEMNSSSDEMDSSSDEMDSSNVFFKQLENLTDAELKFCSNEMFTTPDKLNGMRGNFYGSSKFLPMDITILEKIHNYWKGNDEELKNLERAIEKLPQPENVNRSMQLLYKGYGALPGNVLIDYCLSENLFLQQGSFHFNELIAYWVLEGFLGDFDCIADAYKKGHAVLLDLLDCGLLKEIGYGYVAANDAKLIMDPIDRCEFAKRIPLGLRTVFNRPFYRMVESKGRMKTLRDGIEPDNASSLALILDANSLDRDTHIDYAKLNEQHEIFAYFDPTDEHLPTILFQKSKVRLLVLRGGSYINRVSKDDASSETPSDEKSILKLPPRVNRKANNTGPPPPPHDPLLFHLTVLEISGAKLLNILPDSLFTNMPNVKSLNLSGLGISSLPASLYLLEKVVLLILRNCSKFEALGSLRRFKDLQVLDLSGCKAFNNFHEKSFSCNKDLRFLNLSGTDVTKVPILSELTSLNHLLLKDCVLLKRLPKISKLTNLEILDLSGSIIFEEFHDASIEELVKLKLINLSRTAVKKLPLNFANPQILYMNGCPRLERLSFIKTMDRLSVLDVSDCSKLNDIYPPFFKMLSSLEDINLSATNVKTIPSVSEFKKLRKLKVCNCDSLDQLEDLESLESLEFLDLSESKDMKELKSLEKLLKLKELNLSKTQISSLPIFPDDSSLQILTLKDCTKLESVTSLQVLSKLEKLDLSGSASLTNMEDDLLVNLTQLRELNFSGTGLQTSPSLSKLESLEILCFRNCKELSEIPGFDSLSQLQKLDLSGSAVSNISFEKFSNLQYLGLENCPNLLNFHIDEFSEPGSDGFLFKGSSFPKLKLLEPPLMEQGQQSNLERTGEIEPHDDNQWRVSCWFPGKTLRISMATAQFLRFKKKMHEFHVALHPVTVEANYSDEHNRRNELRFRESYTADLLKGANQGDISGSLEVLGKLNSFPMGFTSAIHQSKRIFLVQVANPEILIPLITEKVKGMEVFWVEECDNLEAKDESTSDGKAGDSDIQKNAASSSDSEVIFSNIISDKSFGNLKFMYLKNCQELNYIGGSSDFLVNLEILQIKYCKALKKLFKEVAILPKLKRLQLWALPILDEISCDMPLLNTLDVGECPGLKNIFPSASPVKNLKILRVRFCAGLKKICVNEEPKLSGLQTLHLWDLPEVVSIGQNLVKPQKYYIRGCPKLIQKQYA